MSASYLWPLKRTLSLRLNSLCIDDGRGLCGVALMALYCSRTDRTMRVRRYDSLHDAALRLEFANLAVDFERIRHSSESPIVQVYHTRSSDQSRKARQR